ncbi:MAG: SAM-dependent methyltransferase [Candidatus Levyibacteriota bacterium]
MAILIICAIIIVILLFLLSMLWPPDSPWSPWWRTDHHIASIQCKLARIAKNDVVYDLGCGDGTLLLTAATEYGARGVGVEIDPPRVFIAKCRVGLKKLQSKIVIQRKDFFAVDISEATVVVMYLIPKTLARLKPKLIKELKPGTRIVTFVYKIDLPLIAADKKNEVYVYQIPKK